jgi:hypothetical protein
MPNSAFYHGQQKSCGAGINRFIDLYLAVFQDAVSTADST